MIQSSRSIRVSFVGGADLHLRIPLINELRERGIEVSVIGIAGEKHFRPLGIPFYLSTMGKGATPWRDIRCISTLRRHIENSEADVVHGFGTKPALLAPWAAQRLPGVAVVRTVAGLGRLFSDSGHHLAPFRAAYGRMQQIASRRTDTTIFQNEDDYDFFMDRGLSDPKKCVLVRSSGIDVQVVQQSVPEQRDLAALRSSLGADGRFVVLMVTRLLWCKGVAEFLNAARSLPAEKFAFLLVGPEAEQGKRRTEMRNALDSSEVMHLGPRDDVPALMAMADAFAFPSFYREGVPRVLLESAAIGTPLIATTAPGCREVVRHGETGIGIPPQDADALARAVEELAQDPGLRARLSTNARELVKTELSLRSVADAHARIYRDLVHQGPHT